jgi:DNA-binding CsgD family transcriptional regulator
MDDEHFGEKLHLNESFPSPFEELSGREAELLILFSQGISRKGAAEILQISPRTIDSYIERIKHKLHLISNREVYQQAIRLREK